MNSIQSLLRPQQRESEDRRDPLDIFREFIACLDRASRRQGRKVEREKSRRVPKR
jgi:hypothetical protein